MSKSMYLINPKADQSSYWSGDVFEAQGLTSAVVFSDLATTTVAALAPDDFDISICEGNIHPVDYDHPADFIGITGKNTQYTNMVKIAKEFRKRGKTVIIGGPFASLEPEAVRDHCDILVVGEMEEIAEDFFNDLREGSWKDFYQGTRPDLSKSPLPRWDLYPTNNAMMGSVQTSRGCPFECEFCDVIMYLGRKQRHKEPAQVIAELDVLYKLGYRAVFLSDDNLTVYRKRAKELLIALRDWNHKQTDGPVDFSSQLSIDSANDPELLQMCTEAGLTHVFIGIETPNEESLREAKKPQNLSNKGGTLSEKVERFVEYGMMVQGGMIVGFDHDDESIFDLQFRFAMDLPVPVFTLNVLVAPAATPLYDRMKADGRLAPWGDDSEATGVPWRTNVIPKLMTRDELIAGTKWLANNLYAPKNYTKRLLRFLELHGNALDEIPYKNKKRSQIALKRQSVIDTAKLVRQFSRLGDEEAKAWKEITKAVAEKPWLSPAVMGSLAQYMQIRHMYGRGQFWDPKLTTQQFDFSMTSSILSPAEIAAI